MIAAPPVAVTPQAPKTPRAANTTRQPSVARAAPPGPRLQLESAPVVAPRASAPMTAGAAEAALAASAAAASAVRVDDAAAQLARERQRIQLLNAQTGCVEQVMHLQQNQLGVFTRCHLILLLNLTVNIQGGGTGFGGGVECE